MRGRQEVATTLHPPERGSHLQRLGREPAGGGWGPGEGGRVVDPCLAGQPWLAALDLSAGVSGLCSGQNQSADAGQASSALLPPCRPAPSAPLPPGRRELPLGGQAGGPGPERASSHGPEEPHMAGAAAG